MSVDAEGSAEAPRTTANGWLVQTRSFFVRSIRELFRNGTALFWALAWPTMFYVIVRLFLLGSNAGPQVAVAGVKALYAISLGMFGAFTVAFVLFSRAFTNDLESKRYRKLRSLPVAPSADLTGRFLGAFALALASFWFVVGVGYLDGAALGLQGARAVPVTVLGLLLFCLIGVSAAVLLTTVMYQGEYFAAIANAILVLLYFGTGFNGIAPRLLPAGTEWLVNWLPNALATRLMITVLTPAAELEAVLSPPSIPSGAASILLLVGYAVALLAASAYVMRATIYRGEGGE